MSLINKVASIIDSKVPLKDLKYSRDFVYEEGQGILGIEWRNILPKPPANDSATTKKEFAPLPDAEYYCHITSYKDPAKSISTRKGAVCDIMKLELRLLSASLLISVGKMAE